MRVLTFEQITDSRFDTNPEELLQERIELLMQSISQTIPKVKVWYEDVHNIDWGNSYQCRVKFYVSKTTRKVAWEDIYKIVNSVNPVSYKFIDM